MMTDPIADLLTRIRNAHQAEKQSVSMPSSKVKCAIASVLKSEGYIQDYSVAEEGAQRRLTIELKYYQGKPVIETIRRISRPGLRTYKGVQDLPTVLGGLGIAVVSTSKGVMSDKAARAQGVGGEILCYVS